MFKIKKCFNYNYKTINKISFSYFNFCDKKPSKYEMIELIRKKEEKLNSGFEEENKFFEEKKIPLTKFVSIIRAPVYFCIFPLIWINPVSQTYYILFYSSHCYLIFLTCFEGTELFSLALNYYNLVNINIDDELEIIKLRNITMRKRLLIMVFFSFFIILSSYLAEKDQIEFSLLIMLLTNFYLYCKFSYHITLYGLNKKIYTQKMKNVGLNAFIIILFFIINANSKRFKNNL